MPMIEELPDRPLRRHELEELEEHDRVQSAVQGVSSFGDLGGALGEDLVHEFALVHVDWIAALSYVEGDGWTRLERQDRDPDRSDQEALMDAYGLLQGGGF